MPDILKAILLGIIEGITEFLPISSTGHLLLCEAWMGMDLDLGFWKAFTIFIQIGAIAAVVVFFRDRIIQLLFGRSAVSATPLEIAIAAGAAAGDAPSWRSSTASDIAVKNTSKDDAEKVLTSAQRRHALWMIVVASLPLVIAYFAHKWSQNYMKEPIVIAMALGIGGIIMILIELVHPSVTTDQIERITWKQALGIGMAQILAAVFPGTSRSAATIMGGMVAGLSREAAAEFSFFLAIPTMIAACGFSLLKYFHDSSFVPWRHVLLFTVGTLVSFLVAWVVIAGFMSYIRRHSFIPFAIYRIVLAIIVFLAVRGQ